MPEFHATCTISHHAPFHSHLAVVQGRPHVIEGPGEYEVKNVGITGVQTRRIDEAGQSIGRNTVYLYEMDDLVICHLGDLGKKLTTSEAETLLLHQLVQNLDQGILVGKDARTRYANRRAAQMLGCSVDELHARSILGFIAPEDLPAAKEKMSQLRQGVLPEAFDQRLVRADGTTLVIEAHVRPLFDRAGRYEGSVSIMTDVTERRAAEAQDRFRAALLDAVGEALMATTSEGTIAYINEAAEALWGWKSEEVVGKNVDTFRTAAGAREGLEEMRKHAAVGEPYSCEIPLLRQDGSEILCSFTMSPVRSAEGERLGQIVVYRDLTERRHLEEELRIRDLRASAVAVLGARAVAEGRDSASNGDALLREIVEATRRLLDVQRARILEVDGDGKLSVRAACPEGEPATVPSGGGSLAGYAVLARTAVVVPDVASERRFDTGSLAPDTRSAIATPVFGPGGVLGVLTAQSSTARSFDNAAIDFMQSLANIVGVALT